MRKYRIWVRLVIAFFVLLLLITGVGLISIHHNRMFQDKLEELYEHPFLVSNSMQSIYGATINMRHKFIMVYNFPESDQTSNRLKEIQELEKKIAEKYNIVTNNYLGNSLDVAVAKKEYENWLKKWEQMILDRTSSNKEPIDTLFLNQERTALIQLNEKMQVILNFASSKATSYYQESEVMIQSVYRIELLLLIVSILITSIVAYLLLRSILYPLHAISRVADSIRSGNLSKRCDEKHQDELGKLGKVLNEMTEQLLGMNKQLEEKIKIRTEELEVEIEKRKKTQHELSENEKKFRSMFESDMFGAAFWNMNGTITQANDRFLEMLGYTRKEYDSRGLNWKAIMPDEYYVEKFEEVVKKFDKKREVVIEDKEYLRKDGSKIPVTEGGDLVSKKPPMGISFAFDISNRKLNEKKLDEYKKNLEVKVNERTKELKENMTLVEDSREALTFLVEDVNDSRNEVIEVNKRLDSLNKELEAFSYSVSHDLKAPLRAIDGFSQALEEDYYDQLDDEAKEYLTLVRDNAKKMGALINDLLEFSRLGRRELSYGEIDMTKLARESYKECLQIEQGRKIKFNCGELQNSFADRTMIKQVFLNLISNALKYSRGREIAEVTVGCKLAENGTAVEYFVTDNGAGFDMKYYDKLFGVFQRLHSDPQFEGTGVGLALIKRIITKHKGEIWGEGETDKGATFHFTLPLKEKNDAD